MSTATRPARSSAREAPARREDAPGPSRAAEAGIGPALRRTWRELRQDNLTDWAAALTYYAVLAVFPAVLALVSVVGLLGDAATQPLLDNLAGFAPGAARDVITGAVEGLQESQGTAGVLVVVGFAAALWSASGYVAAFMRAANAIYDVGEGRTLWVKLPVRVGTTLALLLMLAVMAVGITFTGGLAEAAGDVLGVGDAAVTAWDVAKWPVILLVAMTMVGLLYWITPNVKHPFRWVSPGAVLGVLAWIVASAGFAFYVANFGSYNKTYGTLGGVIVFLVWLWVTNLAFLLGAELNAELERGKRIEEGLPPDEEPFLEPRATDKLDAGADQGLGS